MEKIELTIHSKSISYVACGGNSAYVELVQDQISCKTKVLGAFEQGTTLAWNASTLDTCLGKEFDVLKYEIQFITMSKDGDDYCPKTLKITMSNDYAYQKEGMTHRVDNENTHWQSARRTSGKVLSCTQDFL